MIKKIVNSNSGFSAVEAMVSILIIGVVITGLANTYMVSNLSWLTQDAAADSQYQVRSAIDMMTRDLREAQGVTLTQDADNVSLGFSKTSVGAVTYTWTTTPGSTANQIIRTTPGGARIIARSISSLVVTNNGSNIVVNVTAAVQSINGQTVSFQLANKVAVR